MVYDRCLFLIICTFVLLNTVTIGGVSLEPWTWVYRKTFSSAEQERNGTLVELPPLSKKNIPHFTQLIFSWNAKRPPKGFFRFKVRSRNARTKKWSQWHKMADWGAGIQCSYASKDADVHYEHVRLETEPDLADAFEIKITALEGASLSLVKGCAVNVVNMKNFKPDRPDEIILAALRSVEIQKIPKISQLALKHPRNEEICSPTSCTMLVSFLSSKSIEVSDFAEGVFDKRLGPSGHFGSWPFNTAHVFEKCAGVFHCFVMRLHSFIELYNSISREIPVVVSVRGVLEGAPRPYPNGHLLVVIGFDREHQEVIVHDPAALQDDQVYRRYQLRHFLEAWERSRRLAYVTAPIRSP